MSNCDQARRFRSISLPLLAATAFCLGAQAEDKIEYHKFEGTQLPSYTAAIKARSFESRKYSKGFRVKGWRFRDNIYFGGVKVAGEYGPGMVVDKGRYVWGFNHERIEFQLRF